MNHSNLANPLQTFPHTHNIKEYVLYSICATDGAHSIMQQKGNDRHSKLYFLVFTKYFQRFTQEFQNIDEAPTVGKTANCMLICNPQYE